MSRRRLQTGRRRSHKSGLDHGSHDGILDVLANLIGILTLVGALAAVATANAAVQIKTPINRATNKEFIMLQAAGAGVWNLQPAKDALMQAQKGRLAAMRSCMGLPLFSVLSCMQQEGSRYRSATIGHVTYTLSDDTTQIRRTEIPDQLISKGQSEDNLQTLKRIVLKAKQEDKALFILLEPSGFASYRSIRTLARDNDVELGWEPWGKGPTVYFSSRGRSMTVQ